MVVKMSSPGRSFGGVADYCLHDPRMPGEVHHPESAVRWPRKIGQLFKVYSTD